MVTESNLVGTESVSQLQRVGANLRIILIALESPKFGAFQSILQAIPNHREACLIISIPSANTPIEKARLAIAKLDGWNAFDVIQDTNLESGVAYFLPRNHTVSFAKNTLRTSNKIPQVFVKESLDDRLFADIARECGPRVIAIRLGSESPSSSLIEGLDLIAQNGGLAMIEKSDGTSVEIPRDVLSLDEPQITNAVSNHFKKLSTIPAIQAKSAQTLTSQSINRISRHLEHSFKFNFSIYSMRVLQKQVDRRMKTLSVSDRDHYLKILRESNEETEGLFSSFLIGEPIFFQDIEAYEALKEKVILPLIENTKGAEPIRCWVAGCATGQEAYSIAILLEEAFNDLSFPVNYKIFATDVYKYSIKSASQGIFKAEVMRNLAREQIDQYFIETSDGYRIDSRLRGRVVFAEQNIAEDPPFTRIDIASCRYVLESFNENIREQVVSTLHFSLKKGGALFLGNNETVSEKTGNFSEVSKDHRIYEKTEKPGSLLHLYAPKSSQSLKKRIKENTSVIFSSPQIAKSDLTLNRSMECLLANSYGKSIFIDEELNLIHSFGDCSDIFPANKGRVSLNTLKMIDPALKSAYNSAVTKAIKLNKRGVFGKIIFNKRLIRIVVDPLARNEYDRLYISVRFEDEGRFSDEDPGAFGNTQSETSGNDEDVTKIRRELLTTQDYLQSTVEEFETSNEALQTTNEELLTANEELQSTNEELHSVNEELFTVNTEYKQKNGELKKLNSDFKKLLENTKIGTIFLDQDLTVRRFTPVAAETLNLIPRDLGRPIFHISHNFIEYQDLAEDAKRVHETAQYFEREARTRNGEAYLLRFLPDKESEEEARGVVLTFINISDLKKAEASISEHQNRLDMAEQIANLGTWDWNISEDQVTLDDRFASVSGLPLQGIVTSEEFFREIDASCDQDPHAVILSQIAAKDVIDHYWDLNLPNGQRRYLKGHGAVKRDHSRNPVSFRGVISDQTELKKQQETVSQQKADLETLLYVISHDLREPLRAIHNFSQFLTREEIKADSEKSENYLSRIMRASERMDAFLNEVMLLSRLQKMEIPYERISGNIIVEQALRSLENRIEQTRAQVTVAKDLPELKVSITWAKQAIFNLLANALKFVNPGERPDILVSPYVPLENEYRYSGIVVQDRGPGIPPESVERVFKLFQRAVGNEIEGTGAGLAIVKEVAMKHGGNVYYEARKSGGSRFTITFLK